MMKEFSKDSKYLYFKYNYEGLTITFRRRIGTDDVDVLLDDNFAKANGYSNVRGFLVTVFGANASAKDIDLLATKLKWLRVCEDGIYYLANVPNVPIISSMGEA